MIAQGSASPRGVHISLMNDEAYGGDPLTLAREVDNAVLPHIVRAGTVRRPWGVNVERTGSAKREA